MSTEKKTNSVKESKSKDEIPDMEFKGKLALFLKMNITSVILSVALIFCLIWFTVKIYANSK
ncbi:MAG TPA: hypothetical protein VK861_11790, partial [Bacteroidales bacterium]|nr:hypothetical protein [Bacteroidales bacterium]